MPEPTITGNVALAISPAWMMAVGSTAWADTAIKAAATEGRADGLVAIQPRTGL